MVLQRTNLGTRCGIGSGTGGYLLTIDTSNAQYTLIGRDPNIGNSNGGLTFAPNGTLYFTPCWDNPGFIHTLNPADGHILTSQALDSGDCYMGLAVRPSDGKIFGSYRDISKNTGIYTINPATGAETLVGNPGNILVHDLTFVGQAAPVTQVPTLNEWGTIIFMILSGAGSIYYLRRRKRA